MRRGVLEAIPCGEPLDDSAIHAVLPGGRDPPLVVRRFVDFLVESFGPEPYWDKPAKAPRKKA